MEALTCVSVDNNTAAAYLMLIANASSEAKQQL